MTFALGATARADYNAPLVLCSPSSSVHLTSNCGSDPLTRGVVRIGDEGGVHINVVGGGANLSYSADFRSLDGTQTKNIGTVALDKNGNGNFFRAQLFQPKKTAGAGIVVLSRSSLDEYVSAINVAQAGSPGGPDFRADFVTCNSISIPEKFANCGGDPLKNGNLTIEGDDGTLEVSIHGAAANATYNVVLLQPTPGSPITLDTGLGTDKHGNGILQKTGAVGPGVETGVVVLQSSSGTNEFVGGFDVTSNPPPATLSKSSLVPCLSVNDPPLANCGVDPLTQGHVQINANGKLNASLNGAEPNATYEVVYRPLNNGPDQPALKLTTDANGNASGSAQFIATGKKTVGSGSLVVTGGGFDEFVPGFEVP